MPAHGKKPSSDKVASSGQASRQWTDFEMNTVLALMCKGVHLPPQQRMGLRVGPNTKSDDANDEPLDGVGVIRFTMALNEALHHDVGDEEISVDDVRDVLEKVTSERRAAVDLVARQPTARLTRTQARAFARALPYDGKKREEPAAGGRGRRTPDLEAVARDRRHTKQQMRRGRRGRGWGREPEASAGDGDRAEAEVDAEKEKEAARYSSPDDTMYDDSGATTPYPRYSFGPEYFGSGSAHAD